MNGFGQNLHLYTGRIEQLGKRVILFILKHAIVGFIPESYLKGNNSK